MPVHINRIDKPHISRPVNGPRATLQPLAGKGEDGSNVLPTDTAIANAANNPASATAAALKTSLKPEFASVLHRPINVAEQYGTNDAAVRAAHAAAETASRSLFFREGAFSVTGDLNIDADGFAIKGAGNKTWITFTNGGLILDGSGAFTEDLHLADLALSRTGTAGPAYNLRGASGVGTARFAVSNVDVKSSSGEGVRIDGGYIGTFTACYYSTCTTAIKIMNPTDASTGTGNNLTWIGGEAHVCGVGVYMKDALGVNFIGFGVESCGTSGVEIDGASFGINFTGCYFEANAGWDFKIGTNERAGIGGPSGIVLQGNYLSDTIAGKSTSIILVRSRALKIDSNFFTGYGTSEINVLEAAAGKVRGIAVNNDREDFADIRVALNGAASFNRSQDSGVHQAVSTPGVNPASIAANTETDLTLTVTGVALGDDVTVHMDSLLEAGLSIVGVAATATDTVRVRVRNQTGSAIDPVSRTWRFRIWR